MDSSAFQVVCEVQKLGSGSLVVKSRIQYWDPVAKEWGLVVQMSEHRAKDLGSGYWYPAAWVGGLGTNPGQAISFRQLRMSAWKMP